MRNVDEEMQMHNPTHLSAAIRRPEPLGLQESVDEEEYDSHEPDSVSPSETEDSIVQPVRKRKVSELSWVILIN